jgi:hypothetical protein
LALFRTYFNVKLGFAKISCVYQNVKVRAPEDMFINEDEFSLDNAVNLVSIINSRIYELLEQQKYSKDILESPQFYITYPNSLKIKSI